MSKETKSPAELRQERNKIYRDYNNNIVPERMPVEAGINNVALSGYRDLDPANWHYDFASLEDSYEAVADQIYSDVWPFGAPALTTMRPAAPYQVMNSQSFILAKNGCVQHPEVSGMRDDEYAQLIEKGFDFIVETVIPRQHKNLDITDPVKMAWTIQMEQNQMAAESASFFSIMRRISERKGYFSDPEAGGGGFAEAPFDFLADQLRSFSGISMDVRRHRSEIKDACEVLLPIMFQMGCTRNTGYNSGTFYPLHMPTFMREKDFMELYMPTWKRLIRENSARGIRSKIFLEDDWTRYLDIVADEFPAGSMLRIDESDPALFKKKLGGKFQICGMFPNQHMRSLSAPEIIDKAKEFLDFMLPGGEYVFGFDKGAITAGDLPLDKYTALLEFLRENTYHENAGAPYGQPLNSEGFVPDPFFDQPIRSRYVFNWEEFSSMYPLVPGNAREKLEAANKKVFDWYINLLA